MIERFYDTTFSLSRHEYTGDSSALVSQASFSGHIQQATADTLQQYQGLRLSKAFVIWCATGTDIQEGDRITQGSNTYDVRFITDRDTGNQGHLQIIVEKSDE